MPDDFFPDRTEAGREKTLNEHERRLDRLDRRMTDIERKEAGRDKRWDYVLRAFFTVGTGIIIAIVSLLLGVAGVHP